MLAAVLRALILSPQKDRHHCHVLFLCFFFFFQLHPYAGFFDASAGVARWAGYNHQRGSRPTRWHGAAVSLRPPRKCPVLHSALSSALAAVEGRSRLASMWREWLCSVCLSPDATYVGEESKSKHELVAYFSASCICHIWSCHSLKNWQISPFSTCAWKPSCHSLKNWQISPFSICAWKPSCHSLKNWQISQSLCAWKHSCQPAQVSQIFFRF